jgi:hypothetical protein
MVRPVLRVLLVAATTALLAPGASGEDHLSAFPLDGVAPFKTYPSDEMNHYVWSDFFSRCGERLNELMNDAKAKMDDAKGKASLLLGGTTAAEACKAIENYERAQLKLIRFMENSSEICKSSSEFRKKLKDHYEAALRSKPKMCLPRY